MDDVVSTAPQTLGQDERNVRVQKDPRRSQACASARLRRPLGAREHPSVPTHVRVDLLLMVVVVG
jgi:hypothetical protein